MHAHVPCSTDPGRCAVCLRSLDCAPHLPLTPRATYPESNLVLRNGTTIENLRRAERVLATLHSPRGAVQGGR